MSLVDFDTVVRAQNGDRRALDALLAEARPRAMSIARRILRDDNDADDAVQDACMKAWRHIKRFDGRASFGTWICRITINASLDRLRKRDILLHDPTMEVAHNETPEALLESMLRWRSLRAEIGRLGAKHKQIFMLRELEGLKYREIAAETGVPMGTVMSRLYHARSQIANALVSE